MFLRTSTTELIFEQSSDAFFFVPVRYSTLHASISVQLICTTHADSRTETVHENE